MRPIALLLASFLALPLTAQAPPIERGRALLRRDDPDHAAVLFREAIAQAPDSAEAHYWLGVAYGRQARKANVIRQVRLAMKTREEFERAVELDPNDLQARFALVEFYTLAPMVFGGGDRKAFQQATEIAARDPAMGHEALAFIYADEKRYQQAFEQLEETVKIDPGHMSAWYEIGHLAAITGSDLKRGEEALQRYLSSTPNSDENDPPLARAFYWLGLILEKEGQFPEARQNYAASLRLDPNQADVRQAMKRSR